MGITETLKTLKKAEKEIERAADTSADNNEDTTKQILEEMWRTANLASYVAYKVAERSIKETLEFQNKFGEVEIER